MPHLGWELHYCIFMLVQQMVYEWLKIEFIL